MPPHQNIGRLVALPADIECLQTPSAAICPLRLAAWGVDNDVLTPVVKNDQWSVFNGSTGCLWAAPRVQVAEDEFARFMAAFAFDCKRQ